MGKRKQQLQEMTEEIKRLKAALAGYGEEKNKPGGESSSSDTEGTEREDEIQPVEETNTEGDTVPGSVHSGENIEAEGDNKENDDVERPLSDDVEQALGVDPTKVSARHVKLHSAISKRWSYWFIKGLKADEKNELLETYPPMKEFKIPELNLEIAAMLQEGSLKRDNHIKERQGLAASTLTILGALMSDIMNETEGIDKVQTIERLNDAAKLTTQMLFEQSEARKAFLLPGIDKKYKKTLESAATDDFLFGSSLSEKITSVKAMERISNNIKAQKVVPFKPRNDLNAKGPPARQGYSRAGPSSQSGSGRRRLYFTNKQQPFNARSSNQSRSKPRSQSYRR